jgi:cysteine desulfurase
VAGAGTVIPLDRSGRTGLDEVPWESITLATAILAHNETGIVQDLKPLSEQCRERGIPLHVDAVQAVGKIDVRFRELGATTLAAGAHKFHGPRGIGLLLVRKGVRLSPRLFGGHQERGFRPGTEPVMLVAGMACALKQWHDERERITRHVRELRDRLEQGLAERCPPVVVHGADAPRLPNTLNIAFPGCDAEALLVALDLAGICCSHGSTCASGSAEPSPVLLGMGVPTEVARASIRLSVGRQNTITEIDDAIERISSVIHRQRATTGERGGVSPPIKRLSAHDRGTHVPRSPFG